MAGHATSVKINSNFQGCACCNVLTPEMAIAQRGNEIVGLVERTIEQLQKRNLSESKVLIQQLKVEITEASTEVQALLKRLRDRKDNYKEDVKV